MDNLTASLENLLVFRDKKTNKIVAVEHQNGHLERYDCEPTNNTRTQKLFGAGHPQGFIKSDKTVL